VRGRNGRGVGGDILKRITYIEYDYDDDGNDRNEIDRDEYCVCDDCVGNDAFDADFVTDIGKDNPDNCVVCNPVDFSKPLTNDELGFMLSFLNSISS